MFIKFKDDTEGLSQRLDLKYRVETDRKHTLSVFLPFTSHMKEKNQSLTEGFVQLVLLAF